MTAGEKAASTFNKYFGRLKSENGNYLFPMGAVRDAQNSGIVPVINRGETTAIPLEIGKSVILTSFWIDLNHDGVQANNEILTVTDNNVTIPADAEIGKAKAIATYRDGTSLTFSVVINENITKARTVTAVAGANGSVAIEGANELSITTTETVTIVATANEGYKFLNWIENDEVVSEESEYSFTITSDRELVANFVSTESVDEYSANTFNVFPSPASVNAEINLGMTYDRVEVYNSVGAKVAEYADTDKIEGIETAGVYVIKVVAGSDVRNCRIIVK
jgi:hypothetical protein